MLVHGLVVSRCSGFQGRECELTFAVLFSGAIMFSGFCFGIFSGENQKTQTRKAKTKEKQKTNTKEKDKH